MILKNTPVGIYCIPGDFYIDPWGDVERAVITHGHSDHARFGAKSYLSTPVTAVFMRHRLGPDIKVDTVPYGQAVYINGVKVTLHPAGHIPGSAQVRMEYKGFVAVVSGDFKLSPDPLSELFEPVACHHFVMESTFGLPVYRWQKEEELATEMRTWWEENRQQGKASVVYGWSLGKAQRVLAICGDYGQVYTHGAVEAMNDANRRAGVKLPPSKRVSGVTAKEDFKGSLIIAPPSAAGSTWMRRFGPFESAMASGWMRIRGMRRRRALDKGFALSDHADWSQLNEAVDFTGASKIWVTHGYSAQFANWLRERGLDAEPIDTEFTGEMSEDEKEETPDA